MDFVFTTRLRRFVPLLLAVVAACLAFGSTIFAANIGTVVPIVGQISDLAYDATRNLVYLANPSRNEVDIYSVDSKKLTGSVITGIQPGSLAISADGNTLYVANIGSLTV